MRVLHIITSLHIGGAEKLMVDLLPRLKAKGVEVELLLFLGNRTMFYEQLERENIKIHVFSDTGNVYNPKHLFRLWYFLKKNKYDIIHTHNTAPQIFAAIVSVFLSLKLVTTEHNTTNHRRNWKWYRVIDKWMYGIYRSVICISDAAEENLKSYLGIKSKFDRYITVYNGVDIDKFVNAVGNSFASTHKKIITMVAGFRSQKDQDTLIKAFSILPKDKFELWLVGDGERRKNLELLAESEGIKDRVVFWGVRTDVPEILKTSDIIIMSSHWEGFGLAVVEGMAVGKPIIASNVDGLSQVVANAGLIFPKGDYVQLANLILELTNDKELYNKVAEKCLQRARQYDISKMVDGYLSVYQKLLNLN